MTTDHQNVLSVTNLAKTYRSAGEQIEVLRGVNLSIAAGERVALTGESGSGKSTLLHLIAGLDNADGGEIRLADTPVSGLSDAGRAALRRERLGLGGLLKRYPEQLSGGQQQRVAIGRALAVKPLLLLADEPTGNLDEATADDFLGLARDLVARTGCGFLMVTHSARLAATLDRQINLHAGLVA